MASVAYCGKANSKKSSPLKYVIRIQNDWVEINTGKSTTKIAKTNLICQKIMADRGHNEFPLCTYVRNSEHLL